MTTRFVGDVRRPIGPASRRGTFYDSSIPGMCVTPSARCLGPRNVYPPDPCVPRTRYKTKTAPGAMCRVIMRPCDEVATYDRCRRMANMLRRWHQACLVPVVVESTYTPMRHGYRTHPQSRNHAAGGWRVRMRQGCSLQEIDMYEYIYSVVYALALVNPGLIE